jgi:hypothetical protein
VSQQHDPFETEEERQVRAETAAAKRAAAAEVVTDDVVWLASGPRGRRIIRRALREAGIDVMAARIGASFNPNYGQMCFYEGTRVRAFQLLVELMRALANGSLKLELWQLLMTERDDG